ncbi:MAG: hypothetical protein H0V65_04605 [Chitinophagales bacterium]|nr:hypothetical protein [Chitinophagales bacterium]
MKKLFSIFFSGVLMALALQSCTQPKVDTGREMASIDSLASLRVVAYRDSLQMTCMNSVMTLAQARADSMMQTAMKKTPGKKPKPVTTTTKPVKSDVINRPGTTNSKDSVTITNRPGTINNTTGDKPTITNRPGATKIDTSNTPK